MLQLVGIDDLNLLSLLILSISSFSQNREEESLLFNSLVSDGRILDLDQFNSVVEI